MISHVAFLRAINVGRRRIANAELAEAVASLGFDGVSVYQTSGNVLLGAQSAGNNRAVADRLSSGLSATLGYDVPVIVRSAAEVHAIADARPFGDAAPRAGSKPQVLLMAAVPDASAVAEYSTEADRLGVVDLDVHWWPTVGVSASEFDIRRFGGAFGMMTVRTLGTIQRISARIG